MNNKIDSLLKSYDFPHRFYVRYAVACAESIPQTSKEAIKCIELTHKWLADAKSVTTEELNAAAAAAYAANAAAAYAAAAAAYAATAATAAYAATNAAAYVVYVATNAATNAVAYANNKNRKVNELYTLLTEMIKEEFSQLELMLVENMK